MAEMRFTILGSSGFIGSHLAKALLKNGYDVFCPDREVLQYPHGFYSKKLGNVLYCIGMTANFRTRPYQTIEAHNFILSNILQFGDFESLTYLSSTRVYEGSTNTSENATLSVNPNNLGHLYNLSKLLGESLCINTEKNTKIIRLSNVYGFDSKTDNFLSSVLCEASKTGSVTFSTSPNSSKDYISIKDAVLAIPKIATHGTHKIYNLASGENTDNQTISDFLNKTGIETSFSQNSNEWIFPTIDISRLITEFQLSFSKLEDDLPMLFNLYYQKVQNND
jgi:nucleoside-diphosphate-sugar epimerase